jgi:hypothetical protein
MKRLILTVVIICFVSITFWGCNSSNSNTDVGNIQIEKLVADLETQGYLVQEGEMFFFRLQDEWELNKYFGNNPTSPYGMYRLPPGPGEPDKDVLVFPWDREIDNYAKRSVWRLRPDEAVLFIGKTPPEVLYYGYRTYLLQRYESVDGSIERNDLFASLGNTLNQLTLKTSASSRASSETDPFNKKTILISTADRNMDSNIRQLLVKNGFPQGITNTDIIPALDDEAHHNTPLLNLGYDEYADIFMMLLRVAVFTDPDGAGEDYMNNQPGRIFRIIPKTQRNPDPFTFPGLVEPGTGTTEASLRQTQLKLLKAVRETIESPDRTINEHPAVIAPVEGVECIRQGKFCLGDNHDAQYSIFPYIKLGITEKSFKLSDSNDDFIILVGLNHALTGKGTYSNITPYHYEKQLGIGSLRGDQLIGSAAPYIPEEADSDLFYVAKIARSCGPEGNKEKYCLEVPVSGYLSIPLDEYIFIMNRAYMETETACEPAAHEILEAIVLQVKPKS